MATRTAVSRSDPDAHGPVDKRHSGTHTEQVSVYVDPAKLLEALNRVLEQFGAASTLTPRDLETVLAEVGAHRDELHFLDDLTGLSVPPVPPRELYSGHWHRLPQRLSPEAFLAEFWREYTIEHPHMLFAGHLRRLDMALDSAMRHRASSTGLSVDDFYYRHGVLTQTHLKNPAPAVVRQARIFRRHLAAERLQAAHHTSFATTSGNPGK